MAYVPEKVSVYLNLQHKRELSFFEKKYKFKININSEDELTIPEYKIYLKTKNKMNRRVFHLPYKYNVIHQLMLANFE